MFNDDAEKIKFSREAMAQLLKVVDLSVNERYTLFCSTLSLPTFCFSNKEGESMRLTGLSQT